MNTVLKAFKFRIYPNKEQKIFLAQQFGSVRFIYNYFLNKRKLDYLNNKKHNTYFDDAADLTNLKALDGYSWLYDVNSQTLQSALRNLESAYQSFYTKQNRFPRFHSKNNRQCIKIPQNFKVSCGKLRIPKLKSKIKIKLHQELPESTICLFISKTSTDEYYATFLCEVEIKPLKKTNSTIGIDLGIKNLVITSDNKTIENQKFYTNAQKKLAYEQRQLSKKKRGSKRKDKQRKRVAKVHDKITKKRTDYLHKISRTLINENQVVIAESISVKKMLQSKLLSKYIQDASWAELLRQLQYKAEWYKRTFHQIDSFFPSSKTCNNCKSVLDTLPLEVREWECPNCGIKHDRDLNAAKNILDKGKKDLEDNVGLRNIILKQKLVEALSLDRSKKREAHVSRQG